MAIFNENGAVLTGTDSYVSYDLSSYVNETSNIDHLYNKINIEVQAQYEAFSYIMEAVNLNYLTESEENGIIKFFKKIISKAIEAITNAIHWLINIPSRNIISQNRIKIEQKYNEMKNTTFAGFGKLAVLNAPGYGEGSKRLKSAADFIKGKWSMYISNPYPDPEDDMAEFEKRLIGKSFDKNPNYKEEIDNYLLGKGGETVTLGNIGIRDILKTALDNKSDINELKEANKTLAGLEKELTKTNKTGSVDPSMMKFMRKTLSILTTYAATVAKQIRDANSACINVCMSLAK